MRFRFILSETWNSLKRKVSMIISVMLVTFISFLFIGVSGLMPAQITAAKGEWYDKVEVVVWQCPDGASQAASCSSGKAPSNQEIVDLENVINEEAGNIVSKITYVSREDFYNNSFVKQYPKGEYQGRTLTAADMQDSLWLKLKNPENYRVVSEVLSNRDGVVEVVDQRQIFEPVFSILNRATVATGGLAVIMVLAAIMLTGTTIRMSAASRREETEIMRLVGASNWAIRLPFILEGVIASLAGSLLSCGALALVVKVFVTDWLAKSVTWIPYVVQTTVCLVSPILIVGAMVLSVLASSIALRRYLKA